MLWDDAQARSGEKIKLAPDADIRRVVLCSGKVYYDLYEAREAAGIDDVYLLRLEQLYPFPAKALVYGAVAVPEGRNGLGAGRAAQHGRLDLREPNIEWVLQHTPIANTRARYVGRPASAATATGLASRHNLEQKTLVEQALRRLRDVRATNGYMRSSAGARRVRDRGDGRTMVQEAGRSGQGG